MVPAIWHCNFSKGAKTGKRLVLAIEIKGGSSGCRCRAKSYAEIQNGGGRKDVGGTGRVPERQVNVDVSGVDTGTASIGARRTQIDGLQVAAAVGVRGGERDVSVPADGSV